ncbi:MAG TPA: response regulator transcription factor [Actinomycetota bacterium]|jgi:two-component system OmpR family response regulator|nr:response regulator transcription factor [Actinomycetota bacterium]
MRILLVDDEQRFAAAVRQGLEAEGLAVDVAHDGTEGMWMARSNDYDAIVLDILLPGLNGYRICAELREGGNWTPILMLTALDEDLDEAEALDTGADDYLSKPFSFVVLVARLRALLRRGASPRPAVLQVGNLRLDPAAHRCWCAGQEVELTAKQFALLECFMRHPGEVLSKSALREHVWDYAFADSSNIVEVYVSYLRKKLGAGRIETVRGAGYRLPDQG